MFALVVAREEARKLLPSPVIPFIAIFLLRIHPSSDEVFKNLHG
jgi:hypothetical protein